MARQDPYRNYRFRLEIDGITQGGFSDCSGFGGTIDMIEYREGGEPAYVRKLSGQAKYSNLVLKWGIIDDRSLVDWFGQVAGGQVVRKDGSIILQDPQGNDKIRWNFFGALPAKYDPPDFTGKGTDVAIEMMELAIERLERAK
jgi:phage tail-like protein